ncbi:hypothetical protein FQN50_001784 [Emmonsiellopsis sp. PD_5]|nr:hypothetical protein FQN50_001784 [Emmonsiellopsis sp. PD_5]
MSPPRAVILDIGQACFSGLDPKMPLGLTRGILSTPGEIGTPLYSPPEMAWELSRYGPAADIYSLGLVAYQLFVGSYQINPWLGTAQSAVGDERNRWEVMCTTLRTKGSSRIEHLISEMLAFDMDKRCSARQALGHPSLKQNSEPDHKRAKT